MATAFQIIAILLILVGTAFSLLGVIGYIRLPDVYTRMHAAGKVNVFGVIFLLIAAILVTPLSLGNSLIFIVLLLIAGPVGVHAMASAAYRIGIDMRNPVRDDLAEALYQADLTDPFSAANAPPPFDAAQGRPGGGETPPPAPPTQAE
jgi:multicomponent Na+:H+ antiporter subunit G